MDFGEKLVGWILGIVVVFLISQCVLSPILGIGTGALNELGLGHFSLIITTLAAVSDLFNIDLSIFRQ